MDECIKTYLQSDDSKGLYKIKELYGVAGHKDGGRYDYSKYAWLAKAPFSISNKCCSVMKKGPAHDFQKKNGMYCITAMLASESSLRASTWLQFGCNGFEMKKPISNPMSFWLDQDVLLYIYKNKIPICSVYGDVVKVNEVEGQYDLEDLGIFEIERPELKTTGCNRTGCMFCGYGCQFETPGEGRFELMKRTHPKQYEFIMKPEEAGGLGYKEKIDWLNEHGGYHIKY